MLLAVSAGVLSVITPAMAADTKEIKAVADAVRARFPNLGDFCKLPEADRRKTVVNETMALASARKLADPIGAGPAAGAQLRAECGIDQAPMSTAALRWAATAAPLRFDAGRHTLGTFTTESSLANRVYAPEGPGPFPAVVVTQAKKMAPHLLTHARSLIDAGYAVLVVDTYGPRGYQIGVKEPLPAEFAKDAYDALAHLLSLDYIDRGRIYQDGFSNGGNAAALLASPEGAREFKAVGRFRATVAHYGACKTASPYAGANATATFMDLLSADSDRPILMLMGELDIETPPSTCFPLLTEMKAAGKQVEWHIYPKTTHAWDQAEHNGHVFRTNSGASMSYHHDPDVTRDAMTRTLEFFGRHR